MYTQRVCSWCIGQAAGLEAVQGLLLTVSDGLGPSHPPPLPEPLWLARSSSGRSPPCLPACLLARLLPLAHTSAAPASAASSSASCCCSPPWAALASPPWPFPCSSSSSR